MKIFWREIFRYSKINSVWYKFLIMKRVTIIPRKNAMFRLKIKGYEFPTFLIFKKIIQFLFT